VPAKTNKMKERLRLGIRAHKALLVHQEDEIARILGSDPEYPLKERESDRLAVSMEIAELRGLLDTCRPYVARIKSLVAKISDESVETASYLLFCQAIQHFEAIFLLAAEGLSIQSSELIRSICEALDLVVLFDVEGQSHSNLKKWFDGEIIENREARDSAHRFMNEGRTDPVPFGELKAGIYAALSKYSHMSYAALLESIDVYARDFDWHRLAGFHYAKSGSLPFAREMVHAMIITLKQFYLSRDQKSFRELDKIYESAVRPRQ
jgi:hypothetical protein